MAPVIALVLADITTIGVAIMLDTPRILFVFSVSNLSFANTTSAPWRAPPLKTPLNLMGNTANKHDSLGAC